MTVIGTKPRHRADAKTVTPLTGVLQQSDFTKRSVSVASVTGLALATAISASAAADTVSPTAIAKPDGSSSDFIKSLEDYENATLVSLDIDWDPGDKVGVVAEEPDEPELTDESELTADRATQTQTGAANRNTANNRTATETASRGHTREADYEEKSAPASNAGGVVGTGFQYVGVPYVFGGTSPSGFDCSGFTQYVYRQNGINIGRTSYDQMRQGTSVSLGQAVPGDLVVTSGGGHVGIYIGNGQMLHSPRPGKSVEVTQLSYFSIVDVRRF